MSSSADYLPLYVIRYKKEGLNDSASMDVKKFMFPSDISYLPEDVLLVDRVTGKSYYVCAHCGQKITREDDGDMKAEHNNDNKDQCEDMERFIVLNNPEDETVQPFSQFFGFTLVSKDKSFVARVMSFCCSARCRREWQTSVYAHPWEYWKFLIDLTQRCI